MKFLERISLTVIEYYFLLLSINGLFIMAGLKEFAKFDLLELLAGFVITIFAISKGLSKIEIFVIFFILSIAIISQFNWYEKLLWYDGCKSQLAPMLFFIVGYYTIKSRNFLLEKGKIPFLLTCLIALFLYVKSPEWYINYKMSIWQYTDNSTNKILEMSRLSGFWSYPYWISYGCAIFYSYFLYNSYKVGLVRRNDKIILCFLYCITLLTQQRAPLLIITILTLAYLFQGFTFGKKHRTFYSSMLYYIIIMLLIVVLAFSLMSEDMLLRLVEKIDIVGKSNFIKERADIFSYFFKKDITLFGDGIGRYSHLAYFQGKHAITDHQYLKIVYESGVWGCVGYLIIVGYPLLKGFRNFKYCLFELSIIAFYLIAASGANCLCSFDQHPIVFWMCCGRISGMNYKKTNSCKL